MSDPLIGVLIYLSAFCVAAAISFIGTAVSIILAHKYKFLDYPGKIKLHARPVPYLGGIAIFASFWLVLTGIVWYLEQLQGSGHAFGPMFHVFTNNLGGLDPRFGAIFIGGVVILAVGIVDDRFILKPHVKFAGQVLVGLILIKAGFCVSFFSELGWIAQLLTLIWIVLLLNSFNFIDSINGHCSGIVLVACGAFFAISQVIYQPAIALMTVVLGGAIFGFLPYNFNHARTFLGDNGSLFLGYMMAVISLQLSYQALQPSIMVPIAPLFVFGVPIYDFLTVMCVRLYRGTAPWKGDRNHFAHRLVRMGMDGHDAVLFSYLVGATTGLVGVLSTQISSLRGSAVVVLLYFMILMIIAILEYHSSAHKEAMMRGGPKNEANTDGH